MDPVRLRCTDPVAAARQIIALIAAANTLQHRDPSSSRQVTLSDLLEPVGTDSLPVPTTKPPTTLSGRGLRRACCHFNKPAASSSLRSFSIQLSPGYSMYDTPAMSDGRSTPPSITTTLSRPTAR